MTHCQADHCAAGTHLHHCVDHCAASIHLYHWADHDAASIYPFISLHMDCADQCKTVESMAWIMWKLLKWTNGVSFSTFVFMREFLGIFFTLKAQSLVQTIST